MRTKTGVITSAKMTGTVTVTVHRHVPHPLYQKRFRVSTKFLADTNGHELHEGDEVTITECRPLSKRKCFKVTEILKKAPQVSELVEEGALEGVMKKQRVDESLVTGHLSSDVATSDKRPASPRP